MPNGRPGDHPLTDILHYGSSSYPDDINEFIIEMSKHPKFNSIKERVSTVLWNDWPHWENVEPDFAKVRSELNILWNEIDSVA